MIFSWICEDIFCSDIILSSKKGHPSVIKDNRLCAAIFPSWLIVPENSKWSFALVRATYNKRFFSAISLFRFSCFTMVSIIESENSFDPTDLNVFNSLFVNPKSEDKWTWWEGEVLMPALVS